MENHVAWCNTFIAAWIVIIKSSTSVTFDLKGNIIKRPGFPDETMVMHPVNGHAPEEHSFNIISTQSIENAHYVLFIAKNAGAFGAEFMYNDSSNHSLTQVKQLWDHIIHRYELFENAKVIEGLRAGNYILKIAGNKEYLVHKNLPLYQFECFLSALSRNEILRLCLVEMTEVLGDNGVDQELFIECKARVLQRMDRSYDEFLSVTYQAIETSTQDYSYLTSTIRCDNLKDCISREDAKTNFHVIIHEIYFPSTVDVKLLNDTIYVEINILVNGTSILKTPIKSSPVSLKDVSHSRKFVSRSESGTTPRTLNPQAYTQTPSWIFDTGIKFSDLPDTARVHVKLYCGPLGSGQQIAAASVCGFNYEFQLSYSNSKSNLSVSPNLSPSPPDLDCAFGSPLALFYTDPKNVPVDRTRAILEEETPLICQPQEEHLWSPGSNEYDDNAIVLITSFDWPYHFRNKTLVCKSPFIEVLPSANENISLPEQVETKIEELSLRNNLLSLSEEEFSLLKQYMNTRSVTTKPSLLPKLLNVSDWSSVESVNSIRTVAKRWTLSKNPLELIALLDIINADPYIRYLVVKQFCSLEILDNVMIHLLQPMVQSLKYECNYDSPLARYLLRRALISPLVIGHRIFWLMRGEMSIPGVRNKFGVWIHAYLLSCGPFLRTHRNQVTLHTQLQCAAADTSAEFSADKNLQIVQQHLDKVGTRSRDSILNPKIDFDTKVVGVKVFSSSKKPLRFQYKRKDFPDQIVSFFYKVGDDLRQDQFILQLMRIIDTLIWNYNPTSLTSITNSFRDELNSVALSSSKPPSATTRPGAAEMSNTRTQSKTAAISDTSINLPLVTYACFASGVNKGMVEAVTDAVTITAIHDTLVGVWDQTCISKYIQLHNRTPEKYKKARDLFTRTCAAGCVVSYVLGFGDRHGDNVMVSTDGKIFHIDFGHILGHKKKFLNTINREPCDFLFLPEMAYVVGEEGSPDYRNFELMCCDAYNRLRHSGHVILAFLMLMLPTGMPELNQRQSVTDFLLCRLKPHLSNSDASKAFKAMLSSYRKYSLTKKIDNSAHLMKQLFSALKLGGRSSNSQSLHDSGNSHKSLHDASYYIHFDVITCNISRNMAFDTNDLYLKIDWNGFKITTKVIHDAKKTASFGDVVLFGNDLSKNIDVKLWDKNIIKDELLGETSFGIKPLIGILQNEVAVLKSTSCSNKFGSMSMKFQIHNLNDQNDNEVDKANDDQDRLQEGKDAYVYEYHDSGANEIVSGKISTQLDTAVSDSLCLTSRNDKEIKVADSSSTIVNWRSKRLHISTVSCSDLANVEMWGHKNDVYVVVAWGDMEVRTPTEDNAGDVASFQLNQFLGVTSNYFGSSCPPLQVSVYDANKFRADVHIGSVEFDVLELLSASPDSSTEYNLSLVLNNKHSKKSGLVQLKLRFAC